MPTPVVPSRGVIDITDRVSNVHPQHWRSEVYKQAPLGKQRGMLTRHTSEFGTITSESQMFNWSQEGWNERSGAVLDVYSDAALSSAIASGQAAGVTVYVAVTAANSKLFEVNEHIVLTKTTSNAFTRVTGRVTGKLTAGDTTSYLAVELLESDATNNVLSAAAIRFAPAGASYPNASQLPSGRFYDVTWYQNPCANHFGAYELTAHEIKEKSRIMPNVLQRTTQNALQDYEISMERGLIWSPRSITNPRQYSTGGLNWWLTPANGATTTGRNQINFLTDTTYLGSETGSFQLLGYRFIRSVAEYLGRLCDQGSWHCYCGGLAYEAVQAMIADRITTTLGATNGSDTYGYEFTELTVPSGKWRFYRHPLMVVDAAFQNQIVVVRPDLIKVVDFLPFQYIDPQKFEGIRDNSGNVIVSGHEWSTVQKGGFFSCSGMMLDNFDAHAIIDGVGLDLDRT